MIIMCYKNWYLSSSVVQNSMPGQNSSKFIHEQFHLLRTCVYTRSCVRMYMCTSQPSTSLASQPLPLLIPSHEGAGKGLVSCLCKFRSTALEIVRPIRSEGISGGRGWLARLNLYIVSSASDT